MIVIIIIIIINNNNRVDRTHDKISCILYGICIFIAEVFLYTLHYSQISISFIAITSVINYTSIFNPVFF